MPVTYTCDRCGHTEENRAPHYPNPTNMHSVEPTTDGADDRTLCSDCMKDFRDLESQQFTTQAEAQVNWIKAGPAKP